jgi:hypothetical protein
MLMSTYSALSDSDDEGGDEDDEDDDEDGGEDRDGAEGGSLQRWGRAVIETTSIPQMGVGWSVGSGAVGTMRIRKL